jgi:predicted PurR-regulated permease PerM
LAKSILLPIVLAIFFSLLLAPVVRFLKKFWVPTHVSASFLVIILFFSLGFGFYSLSGPTKQWLAESPQNIPLISQKIEKLVGPFKSSIAGFARAKEQITQTTNQSSKPGQEISVKQSSFLNVVVTSTTSFLFQLFMFIFMLYFLLAYDDFFLRKVSDLMPGMHRRKDAAVITHQIEREISVFLVAKVVTGFGLAVVITVILFFFKMPDPILWGTLAGILEFVPYLGVTVGTILIGIASLIHFDNPLIMLLIPLIFFSITSLNGNFVFPLVIGKNLEIHPVIVFVGVIFWGWIWGIIGALIAIPLLSVLKIIFNNVRSLNKFSKLLGK